MSIEYEKLHSTYVRRVKYVWMMFMGKCTVHSTLWRTVSRMAWVNSSDQEKTAWATLPGLWLVDQGWVGTQAIVAEADDWSEDIKEELRLRDLDIEGSESIKVEVPGRTSWLGIKSNVLRRTEAQHVWPGVIIITLQVGLSSKSDNGQMMPGCRSNWRGGGHKLIQRSASGVAMLNCRLGNSSFQTWSTWLDDELPYEQKQQIGSWRLFCLGAFCYNLLESVNSDMTINTGYGRHWWSLIWAQDELSRRDAWTFVYWYLQDCCRSHQKIGGSM